MTEEPPSQDTQPLLENFIIPAQLLEQWLNVAPAAVVTAQLTRQDLDHLLFSLLRLGEAQSKLETVLVHWSHGRTEEANKALNEFRQLNNSSQNNAKQFFTALIAGSLKSRSDAK